MNVPCPKCQVAFDVVDDLMRSGVARTCCPHCNFAFVMRLGEPSKAKPAPPPPPPPDVRSSKDEVVVVGALEAPSPRFVPAQTRTTVVVDPELNTSGAAKPSPPPPEPAPTAPPAAPSPPPDPPLSTRVTETDATTGALAERVTETDTTVVPLAARPTEADPAPAVPTAAPVVGQAVEPLDGFGGISSPSIAVQPIGLVHPPQPTVAPQPLAMQPAMQPVMPVPVAAQPALPPIIIVQQATRRRSPALAVVVLLLLLAVAGGALYALYHFGWIGGAPELPRELRGLDIAGPPIVKSAQLKNARVLVAEGVVRNNGANARRFIYVRGELKLNARTVSQSEAPAGNVLATERLGQLTIEGLETELNNPAGKDGRNTKLEAGQSVAFMVVLTNVPADYSAEKYSVVARVVRAEIVDD